MKVTYAPAGADAQEWAWDPGDVLQSEAELIQKRYGGSWDDFTTAVRDGDARARRVLLWHFLRQAHKTLRYEDTPDFRMRELRVEFDLDELLQLRDRLQKADIPEDQREQGLASIEFEISERLGEAAEPEPPADVEPGKASSASG